MCSCVTFGKQEDVLTGEFLYFEWAPSEIDELLRHFTPSNVRIDLLSALYGRATSGGWLTYRLAMSSGFPWCLRAAEDNDEVDESDEDIGSGDDELHENDSEDIQDEGSDAESDAEAEHEALLEQFKTIVDPEHPFIRLIRPPPENRAPDVEQHFQTEV